MFIDNMLRGTGAHFDCLDCRTHALEHMNTTDPIRNILTLPVKGRDGVAPIMACSAWVFRFHEAVNTRLQKPRAQRPLFKQFMHFLSDLREGKGCHDCGPIGAVPPVAEPPPPKPTPVVRRKLFD